MQRRKPLILSIVYLALFVLAAVYNLSDVFQHGVPLTQSEGFSTSVVFASFIPLRVLRVWQNLRVKDLPALRDPNATVTLRESVAERVCSAVCGLGVFAMGALPLLGFPSVDVPTPLLVLPMLMGGYFILSSITRKRGRLTLSPRGVDLSQMNPSFISWDEISGSKVQTWIVRFELREAKEFTLRGNRKRSFNHLGVMARPFGIDSATLVEAIEARRAPHVFHPSASPMGVP